MTATKEKKADREKRIIISIGSNYNAHENMSYAKKKLSAMLGKQTRFTKEIWTDPIGIDSGRFINCVCVSATTHTLPQITRAFKQLEKRCERSKKNDSQNKIPLDIDILLYGNTKLHADDWEREYIKALLEDYENELFIIDTTL